MTNGTVTYNIRGAGRQLDAGNGAAVATHLKTATPRRPAAKPSTLGTLIPGGSNKRPRPVRRAGASFLPPSNLHKSGQMIPIHLRLLRLIPAAAAAFCGVVHSGQRRSPAGFHRFHWRRGVRAACAVALSSGRSRWRPRWTDGSWTRRETTTKEFDVIITWSEDVEGFRAQRRLDVDDGRATDLTGSGDRYTLTIEPDEIEGYVTITIRAGRG